MAPRRKDRGKTHGATLPRLSVDDHVSLVVIRGEPLGRRYPLELGPSDLGRSTESTIMLEDDQVSRKHAILHCGPAGICRITDAGSRNGTFVNGQRVTEAHLEAGDRIEVGSHVLLFTHRSDIQEQVLQQQRLEAIGRMAAGVVHDFNNMLGVILASADYVLRGHATDGALSAETLECMQDIRSSARQAHDLTRRLLDLSGRQGGEYREVDVSELCEDTCRLLRGVIPQRIDIRCEVEPNLLVIGDYAELHHVLVNLLLNARDAMPRGGLLRVTGDRHQGESIRLRVEDDGVGMGAETLQRVFEPFFTTKQQGYGLGLATVREIVLAHGGSIDAKSRRGEGTTFEVLLPAGERGVGSPRVTTVPPSSARKPRAAAVVLVVDDEPAVRRTVTRVLRQAGYQTLDAANGRQAVKRYLERDPSPDLVLLDLDMPVLDGFETLDLLTKLDPEVRVLMVSAMLDGVQDELTARGARGLVSKPFETDELLAAVASQLPAPRGEEQDEEITSTHEVPPKPSPPSGRSLA